MKIYSNNNINFQAKLINADNRVQKYVKSAFITNPRDTLNTLETYRDIHQNEVTILSLIEKDGKNYMSLKNGVTGKIIKREIKDANSVQSEDKYAIIDLLKQVISDKKFWIKK
jgi:hypothetical protein